MVFVTPISGTIILVHPDSTVSTVQGGIDLADEGDTVLVVPGLYCENVSFLGKSIVVASHFLQTGEPSYVDSTIIDGTCPSREDTASVVRFVSGEDSTSVLVGFTLQNGLGTEGQYGGRFGGGIFCKYNSTPTILHNRIIGNSASTGGGIYCDHFGSLTIHILHNEIRWNSCTGFGGGLYVDLGGAEVRNNVIEHNTAVYGGGIAFQYGWENTIDVEGNVIAYNHGTIGGGGVWQDKAGCTLRLHNNLILSNVGPGVENLDYDPSTVLSLTSNTILGNETGVVFYAKYAELRNNVIVDNDIGIQCIVGEYELTHNDVWNNVDGNYVNCVPGVGSISEDPLFVAGPEGIYYLSQTDAGDPWNSPCVDSGYELASNLGLNTSTTRTDEFPDSWVSDMGYHYLTPIGPCGDANEDGHVTTADGYHILGYLGAGSPPSFCWIANTNGDDEITPADGYRLLNFFGSGLGLDCRFCEF
jgi:hypothetical protein